MAFTEFTCRAGGNNLNAGSLDGIAEAAAAPLITYTNGGWNSGTGVFTPAAGNPVAAGVAVGQWASVYIDGAAAPTGFVGRITAVTTTTITVSLTAKLGSPPSTLGTGRTLVVGGAWRGPNAADRFPINSVTSALANTAGNRPRVNLKNDQQYVPTATWAETGSFAGAYYEGYTAAFGDGGFAVVDGGVVGASFTLLSFSSATPDIEWRYVTFQNNGATGAVSMVTGGGPNFYRCRFLNSRGFGCETTSTFPSATFIECEGSGCNQANSVINGSGGAPFGANSSSGVIMVRCYSHDNSAGGNCCGVVTGSNSFLDDCIIANNAGIGVFATGFRVRVRRSTIYGNGSHGVSVSGGGGLGTFISDNVIVSNGGFGVNGGDMRAVNNAFYLNTSGQYSTLVTGDKFGTVTLTGNPFVDAANNDFRLNATAGAGAACRAAGQGTFLINGVVTTVSFPDDGAAQHADPTQPAVGNVRLGTIYNDGGSTGTLVLPPVGTVYSTTTFGAGGTEYNGTVVMPPVNKVETGYGFGAGGTEFVGTLSPSGPTDYPPTAAVQFGYAYNFGALVGTLLPTFTPPPSVLALSENAERVREAVRAKLHDALPVQWTAYARKEFAFLVGDQYPLAYCVLLPERILEVETDNQVLVGYPVAVALLLNEAAVLRTDPPLSALRRTAQQALHTTAFPGLIVEDVEIEEGAGVPLPDVEDGVTATAFVVVVALVEEREAA